MFVHSCCSSLTILFVLLAILLSRLRVRFIIKFRHIVIKGDKFEELGVPGVLFQDLGAALGLNTILLQGLLHTILGDQDVRRSLAHGYRFVFSQFLYG